MPRINRNILECKVLPDSRKLHQENQVLIETYWNVKLVLSEQFVNFLFVLIETYWNVKVDISFIFLNPRSINRNILECKEVIE